MKRVLVTAPIYNEQPRIEVLLRAVKERLPADCDMLFVDDASDDGTAALIAAAGFDVVRHERRLGCGPAVRTGLEAAVARGYSIAVVMAGNGKDDPAHASRLVAAIDAGSDFVQGSRYLAAGGHANMPLHRKLGTRAYSALFSLLGGKRITDATNGYRAVRTTLLEDRRFDLHQSWLEDYEVESYLFFKAIQLGYRVSEAPVTKIYPPSGPYTKMRPFAGWWSHFRPAVLLALHLKS